jgi:hypothetical protein
VIVMGFTLYGIEIPLWLLFSLALIGLVTSRRDHWGGHNHLAFNAKQAGNRVACHRTNFRDAYPTHQVAVYDQ